MVPNEEKRKAVAAKRLWGFRHDPGADAVMGLGFYPSVAQFQYFVGSLEEDGVPGRHRDGRGPRKKTQEKGRGSTSKTKGYCQRPLNIAVPRRA